MTTTSAKPVNRRTSPLIWVKQIALYKSLSPVVEIRSIPFTPGLNIIQGKSDDSAQDFEFGHGNGKTTLCRLIRYCLGERTFGQQHVVEEVKYCFPKGYVGAVIVVDEDEWSVLRALGHRGKEYAQQGIALADLVLAEDRQPYSEFLVKVQQVGLSGLPQRDVLAGGQAIQWLHLLALCSRDQESRYDRFWNLRHARSDSGSPKFTKSDVSLCVRAVLGLLDIKESQIRDRLDVLETELGKLRENIKAKSAEPAFHITQIRTRLVNELEMKQANDPWSLQDGLFHISKMCDDHIAELRRELTNIEERIAPLDVQISLAAVQLKELLEMQERDEAASEVTVEGTTVVATELDKLRAKKQELTDRSVTECKPGRILYGDCSHVKEHLADLDRRIAAEQRQTLPEVSERDQTAAQLANQARRQNDPLDRLRQKLRELNEVKNELSDRRRVINELLKQVPLATTELLKWHKIVSGEEANHALTLLEAEERSNIEETETLKTQLGDLLSKQNERAKQFRQRFHNLIQKTINDRFKGVVVVENEELTFRINRERSLSGEAYETLAVLLADLAILLESSMDGVCHPGLLIHDSPREADLNAKLYERMLDTAFSLMRDGNGSMPYQYIVTTTTQPSEALRSAGVTKDTFSSGSGSLFGMQLETGQNGSDQRTFFDSSEAE